MPLLAVRPQWPHSTGSLLFTTAAVGEVAVGEVAVGAGNPAAGPAESRQLESAAALGRLGSGGGGDAWGLIMVSSLSQRDRHGAATF
jgi:hypothetical protein